MVGKWSFALDGGVVGWLYTFFARIFAAVLHVEIHRVLHIAEV